MKHILKTKSFTLTLIPQIFEEDINYPVNTTLEVSVQSSGFSGAASMDVDAKSLANFAEDLSRIYGTLSGEARIEEPYGVHMYLSFIGDGCGHITVSGQLQSEDSWGNRQVLEFENQLDQTYLREFCNSLNLIYRNQQEVHS